MCGLLYPTISFIFFLLCFLMLSKKTISFCNVKTLFCCSALNTHGLVQFMLECHNIKLIKLTKFFEKILNYFSLRATLISFQTTPYHLTFDQILDFRRLIEFVNTQSSPLIEVDGIYRISMQTKKRVLSDCCWKA